jgi:hypothetical protein
VQRAQGWVGRKDRHPVEIDAVVHRADGCSSPVTVSNLSEEGCRIEGEDLRIGERVEIAIPQVGRLNAQVRWALPGSAGARFLVDGDF